MLFRSFYWQLIWFISFYSPKDFLNYYAKLVYLTIIPLPFTFYHFIISYLKKQNEKIYLFVFYGFAAILLTLLFLTDLFVKGNRATNWGNFSYPGPLYSIFTATALISMIRGLFLIQRERTSQTNPPVIKNQINYLFTAFILYFFCSLDFFQVYGARWYPVGSFFFLASCSIIAYAILKHQLLDIKIAVRKTIFYSTLTILMSMVYISVVFLFYSIFLTSNKSPFFVNFIGILFIAATFKPFELLFHRFLEKSFFKGTIAQISEQKERLETEIERRERLKSVGILAAGMAHEIKNPLTSIKTFAEYLPKKYNDPEFREKFSRIVVDEVDRVNNIVEQLLEFSKPSDPNLKPVLIAELLDQTVSLLNNNMLRHGIELSKHLDPYAIVLADPNQLKQVFLNILLNSIQSMPSGGKLSIIARAEATAEIKVTISDTGCGISAEQLTHVFDPFYTTKEDGTGLGLAIVHGIITKHGGKIQMESEPGKGTTVNVTLKSQS